MAVNAIGMALAYLTHVLFAKWLGVAQYGDYVYALAWLNVLTVVVQLGMNTSVERITAELRGENNLPAILGLSVFSTLVIICFGSLIIILSAVIFVPMVETMSDPKYLTLAVMLPLLIILCLLYQRMALLQGFERVAQAQVFLEIIRPVFLIGLVWACLNFFNINAYLTMAANLIATSLALGISFVFVRRFLLKEGSGCSIREYHVQSWLAVSLPYLLIGVLTVIMNQSDVLMLGSLLGSAAAGLYTPAVKLAQLALFPMLAIRSRAAPLMARLYAENNLKELQHQMNITTITSILSGGVLVAGLIVFAEPLLGLFGEGFIVATPVLVVLVLGMLVFAMTGGIEVFLIFGPFERVTVLIYVFIVALNLTMNAILIPKFGVVGAAYATSVTVAIRGLISTYIVWRRTGILPWRRVETL